MTERDGNQDGVRYYRGLPLDFLAQISPDIIEMQATLVDPSTDITISTIQLLEQIDTYAQENPESSYWDSIKRAVITDLLAVDQPDLAIEVFWTMTSGHEMAETLTVIKKNIDANRKASLVSELCAAAPYCPNIGRTIQAVRDNAVARDPSGKIVRSLNRFLMVNGIEDNPIDGWIDSQTELYNDVNWSSVVKNLKDEVIWGDTPVENRLYLANLLLIALEQLYRHSLNEEEAVFLVGEMNQAEANFPEQQYTDMMRYQLASTAIDVGAVEIGIAFANLIKQEGYLFHLVEKLDGQGDTIHAFQLANSMDDPAVTMKLLLGSDWVDQDRTNHLIENLLNSNLDSLERRIGYFTFLRDYYADNNQLYQALEMQDNINELKAED
ncbi:MAG: hypothetical protein QG553_839 [Patescibacteria group bacterium]|nr:hypothetical protein [Patescibacteria group bacterium]